MTKSSKSTSKQSKSQSKFKLFDTFQNQKLPMAAVIVFVVGFAAIGAYIIAQSSASTSDVMDANNLVVRLSKGASVVTETSTGSKRQAQVIELSSLNLVGDAHAVLFKNFPLSIGTMYQACMYAKAVDRPINGNLEIRTYSGNVLGAVIGQGQYGLYNSNDYTTTGCFTFPFNSFVNTVAANITNTTYNSTLHIARVTVTPISKISAGATP